MSRPERWWRPETNRRPAGGARRRVHARRKAAGAFDAGYAAGKAEQASKDQRLRDSLAELVRAVDAADNGDPTLLDDLTRQAGASDADASVQPEREPYRCPSWCTTDHDEPEQLADDLAVQSRGHYADVAVVLRDYDTVAVVSLVAVDNLETGTRTPTDVALNAHDTYTPDEAAQIIAGISEAARIARADEQAAASDGAQLVADLEAWMRGEAR
ncbi:hypothetical protein [Micromonospora sp. NPDC049374]|uniref:DUF6907 domain-containing protein n=1 Tax=Micromonospora sp. NPDC049374 TaxID=3154352 RepID=UPI0034251437